MATEFIIYTDESDECGTYFADFYGGALIRSCDLQRVVDTLNAAKAQLHFFGEVKWTKVTDRYLDKYKALMSTFFELVALDLIKVRVMFTQNRYVPTRLNQYHLSNKYQLLYYQFLKHAFGLQYSNVAREQISLRIMLDELPCNRAKADEFKGYLAGLENLAEFKAANIRVPKDQIAEVTSHDHVVMQCLDIVLGSMQFRLNNKHLEKPAGKRVRGKRTIAKESLYKHIKARLCALRQSFNVGITTGLDGQPANRFLHSYRHWLFVPSDHAIDARHTKPK